MDSRIDIYGEALFAEYQAASRSTAGFERYLERHHVDLVLQGHDHAYLRTQPMRAGRPVASPAEGTVYVVSVSGEKFYEQGQRDYAARGMTNLATYQTIDIHAKEKRLDYRSFDREGREVDALVIEKGPSSTRLAGRPAK